MTLYERMREAADVLEEVSGVPDKHRSLYGGVSNTDMQWSAGLLRHKADAWEREEKEHAENYELKCALAKALRKNAKADSMYFYQATALLKKFHITEKT